MRNYLAEVRKQAEEAVHDMPDGDLKLKAFETILSHLLSSESNTASRPPERRALVTEAKSGSTKVPRSLSERVVSLKGNDFFAAQRSIADIRQELKKHGWHYPVTSLSGTLQSLVQQRILRREQVADGRGRKAWRYSNP